ncbi:hypothetical protein J1TS5_10300 [Paenibacillus macerans]|nr:hypothetical protein J1TS5_10300 [Paenibacillus macerans]
MAPLFFKETKMNLFIMGCMIIYCLVCSYTDLKALQIKNSITYPFLLLMLILRIQEPAYYAALVPALLFLLMYLIKPQFIGAGDIKMLAVLGLCLGAKIVLVIFVMSAGALVYTIYERARGRKDQSVPLAPFLSVGAVVAIII